MRLESTEGKGSTFFAIIPPSAINPKDNNLRVIAPAGEETEEGHLDIGGLRLLVAEDNLTNAMVIRAYLQSEVDQITIVENGALAVDAVASGNCDLVLMDKQMPIMDGVVATKAIRELPGSKAGIPIIAVTADAFEGASDSLVESGMDGYVSKPLDAGSLKREIYRVLRSRDGAHVSAELINQP